MSHFTVMVIGSHPEQQLEKYSEHIDMPRYIKYTKEQLIAKYRKNFEDYKNTTYAGYLEDPEKYKEHVTVGHYDYVSNEFPKRLLWTDEQILEDAKECYDGDIDEEFNVWSTYNPDSKWDWYQLGGRWSGMLKVKSGAEAILGDPGVFGRRTQPMEGYDMADKGDIINLDEIVTFAVVKDGEWYESGDMGWWGMVSNEKDPREWADKIKELLNELPDDTMISIFDCHI